jgi:hypothetical protein
MVLCTGRIVRHGVPLVDIRVQTPLPGAPTIALWSRFALHALVSLAVLSSSHASVYDTFRLYDETGALALPVQPLEWVSPHSALLLHDTPA